jgi:hypothetical protein
MVQDLKKGAALLDRIIRALENYADRPKSRDADQSAMTNRLGEEQALPDQDKSSENEESEEGKS